MAQGITTVIEVERESDSDQILKLFSTYCSLLTAAQPGLHQSFAVFADSSQTPAEESACRDALASVGLPPFLKTNISAYVVSTEGVLDSVSFN